MRLLNVGSYKLLIAVIYRPPHSAINRSTVNDFIDEFGTFLESIITSQVKVIIGGDFNFHIEDTTSSDAGKFLDLLKCHNLNNHIEFPTHEKTVFDMEPVSIQFRKRLAKHH